MFRLGSDGETNLDLYWSLNEENPTQFAIRRGYIKTRSFGIKFTVHHQNVLLRAAKRPSKFQSSDLI